MEAEGHEWECYSGGMVSGLVAGLTGTDGAIRGIALAAFDLEKIAFVSTSAWIDMGVDLGRSVVYASQGFMSRSVLTYLPTMAVASWLGNWIGKRTLHLIPQQVFRIVVLSLVVVMGPITLLGGG